MTPFSCLATEISYQPAVLSPWNAKDQIASSVEDDLTHVNPQRLRFAFIPQRRAGVDLFGKIFADGMPTDDKMHDMILGN